MFTMSQFKLLRTAIDSRLKELGDDAIQLERTIQLERMLFGQDSKLLNNIEKEETDLSELRKMLNQKIDSTIPVA